MFPFSLLFITELDKPIVDKERLTRHVDNLRLSVLFKLRSKSRSNAILDFDRDCFRFLFYGEGKKGREERRCILCKNKDDFNKCDLPENWDRVIDCNGNGGKGGN